MVDNMELEFYKGICVIIGITIKGMLEMSFCFFF